MNRTYGLVALAALASLSPSTAAYADDTYVVSHDIVTGWMANRFSRNGFAVAEQTLQDDYAAYRLHGKNAIVDAGGVLISANLQEWGIGDEDRRRVDLEGWAVDDGTHTVYRRRGRMDLLFQVPEGTLLPQLLANAKKIDSRSQVSISLQARRKGTATGYLRRPPRTVSISLDELRQIQKAPAGARRTGYGAVLRRAWTEALNGTEDDVETIEAIMKVELHSLRPSDGSRANVKGQRLDATTTDLVLGRRGTHGDWWAGLVGRDTLLPTADERTALLLSEALRRVAPTYDESNATQDEWDRVAELRAGDPAALTDADRLFLRTGRSASGALNRIPD